MNPLALHRIMALCAAVIVFTTAIPAALAAAEHPAIDDPLRYRQHAGAGDLAGIEWRAASPQQAHALGRIVAGPHAFDTTPMHLLLHRDSPFVPHLPQIDAALREVLGHRD
jgi:hypothetical protein